MHNGPIDILGATGRIRSLTRGRAKVFFECREWCSELAGDWSPDGTLLAFASDHPRRRPDDGLYVWDPASGGDRLVVPGGDISQPAWSPDGSRIAYSQLSQIFVVNEDGSGHILVDGWAGPASPSTPSWSPDGSRLVYAAYGWLYVVGLDGLGSIRLVKGYDPTWSPDGTTIAYVAGQSLRDPSSCEIRETTGDGHRSSRLIDLAAIGTGHTRCGEIWGLEWSPDGAKLAILALRQPTPESRIEVAMFVVRADGSGERLLASWKSGRTWSGLAWQPRPPRRTR